MPGLRISGWSNLGNAEPGSPFRFRDNQSTATANMSWVKRAHTLRRGLDYWNQEINHIQPQGGTFPTARGTLVFDGNATALRNGPGANRFNSWPLSCRACRPEPGKLSNSAIQTPCASKSRP